MTRRLLQPLRRLANMAPGEAAFRARGELRKVADRTRWRLSPPGWDRRAIRRVLAGASPGEGTFLSAARDAAYEADWAGAHSALLRHLLHQPAAFPLAASAVERLAARVRARFPGARADARARLERMVAGNYDLLGYRDLHFGVSPDWHLDPAHGRHAPEGFWADVPYLDPGSGDHKIIWEINRHQHWLALGRAHALDGDRRAYAAFTTQLDRWLAVNPPLAGINWASMLELAFRALSWLWAAHLFAAAALDEPGPPWMVDLLVGLDRQLAHIEPNLSRYFSPNTHLTGEALALYVCGLALPWLRGSPRRAEIGRDVLVQEATRQVLDDGGHAELSAHYHRYSTDFYLLALQVARAGQDPAADVFEDAARRQARFLRAIADDNGRLPLVGDDDGGQLFPICGREPDDCRDTLAAAAVLLDEPPLAAGEIPEEVCWRCGESAALDRTLPVQIERTPVTSVALASSGYFVSRTAAGNHLILDAGHHGFLNAGHAHADALSIVGTVSGRPLLIDPGTATYTMDPLVRDRFRSTAMHNTVVVNGLSQSQPRGPFHWRTRADAQALVWRAGETSDYVEGRHAAYAPIVHARGVLALHDDVWLVIDHFLGGTAGGTEVGTDAFWHLHPDWSIVSAAGSVVTLAHRDGTRQRLATSGRFESVRGTRLADLAVYAPRYGRIVPAECLVVRASGVIPRSLVTVVPLGRRSGMDVAVEPLSIDTPPADGWHGAAWRVRFDDAELVLLASSEQGLVPRGPDAPLARWGTADVQIVGRVGLLAASSKGWRAVLVNGRHLSSTVGQVNHDLAQPLIELNWTDDGALRPEPVVEPTGRDRP